MGCKLKEIQTNKTESSNRIVKAPTQLINILLELNHRQKMVFENQYHTVPIQMQLIKRCESVYHS